MKRLFSAVPLLFLLVTAPVFAQTTVTLGSENTVEEDSFTPVAYVYTTRGVSDNLKVFGFAAYSRSWAEGYAGITFSPRPWITLGAGAGLEQDKNPWRLGGTLFVGNKKDSLFFIGEAGGSGKWYRGVLNHKIGRGFGVGAISQAFLGTGPRLEFTPPGKPLTVWASGLYEGSSKPSYILGATFTF